MIKKYEYKQLQYITVNTLALYSESSSAEGGLMLPVLTVDDVANGYNAFVAGKKVVVVDADEENMFDIIQVSNINGTVAIYMDFEEKGKVCYKVVSNAVTRTFSKFGDEVPYKITSVTIGADTIDIVIS